MINLTKVGISFNFIFCQRMTLPLFHTASKRLNFNVRMILPLSVVQTSLREVWYGQVDGKHIDLSVCKSWLTRLARGFFAMPLQVLVTYVHFYSHFNKVCHVLRRKFIMAWKLCHHYKILMFQQILLQKMMKCISKNDDVRPWS